MAVITPETAAQIRPDSLASSADVSPGRIDLVDQCPCVLTDQFNERRYTQRLPDVLDVDHEHGDADENEQK